MITDDCLAKTLRNEQRDLISLKVSEFWQELFYGLLKKHSFQNDFHLVPNSLSYDYVVSHIRLVVSELSRKYGFMFYEARFGPQMKSFVLQSFYPEYASEIPEDFFSVDICQKTITLKVLPYNLFSRPFNIEESFLVGNILMDLCDSLYNPEKENCQLKENINKILLSAENLTLKTIEMARNSIKTLYESSPQKYRSLVQTLLYSKMNIGGKEVLVFHKDFLSNPCIMTNMLKKTESALTGGIAL